MRLGGSLWRELGPRYVEAVMVCLYGVLGISSDLEGTRVQEIFFYEVVQKLEMFAEAVGI